MPNQITINELQVETSFGITVTYKLENNQYKQHGVTYPITWTDPNSKGEEFKRQETISEEVLEGRKAGAIKEANERLKSELENEELKIEDGFTLEYDNITIK